MDYAVQKRYFRQGPTKRELILLMILFFMLYVIVSTMDYRSLSDNQEEQRINYLLEQDMRGEIKLEGAEIEDLQAQEKKLIQSDIL